MISLIISITSLSIIKDHSHHIKGLEQETPVRYQLRYAFLSKPINIIYEP